jgi:Domain of unknown function (DUF397)
VSNEGKPSQAEWRKATASTGNGACIEVFVEPEGAKVRDSQDRSGPVMSVSQPVWRRFVLQIKSDHSGHL